MSSCSGRHPCYRHTRKEPSSSTRMACFLWLLQRLKQRLQQHLPRQPLSHQSCAPLLLAAFMVARPQEEAATRPGKLHWPPAPWLPQVNPCSGHSCMLLLLHGFVSRGPIEGQETESDHAIPSDYLKQLLLCCMLASHIAHMGTVPVKCRHRHSPCTHGHRDIADRRTSTMLTHMWPVAKNCFYSPQ